MKNYMSWLSGAAQEFLSMRVYYPTLTFDSTATLVLVEGTKAETVAFLQEKFRTFKHITIRGDNPSPGLVYVHYAKEFFTSGELEAFLGKYLPVGMLPFTKFSDYEHHPLLMLKSSLREVVTPLLSRSN